MYTIHREYQLAVSHRLPFVPPDHKCGRLHGHNFTVTLECSGPLDEEMGWIFDFAELDAAWATTIHAVLDHRDLNAIPGLENPTSEVLARWVFDRMEAAVAGLSDGARLDAVSVGETVKGFVRWSPPKEAA